MKSVSAPPEPNPPRPRFERLKTGAAIFGGVTGGIAGLIKIAEFVVNHWPQIEHTFRIIMPNGMIMQYQEVWVRVKRREVSEQFFVDAFERWFFGLPSYVRANVQREFGDVREIVASVRIQIEHSSYRGRPRV